MGFLGVDGTTGTSVVTISVTDKISGATQTLGTKSLVFYGTVASLKATTIMTVAPSAGGYLGAGSGNAPVASRDGVNTGSGGTNTTPAVVIYAADSAGNPVGGLTIKTVTSDSTQVNAHTSGDCVADTLNLSGYSSGGVGYYNCMITTAYSATSGKTATITYEVLDPADPLGVAYLTAPVSVTIGGSVYSETLSLDSTTYQPGAAMVITVLGKDKAGNTPYDGQAATAGFTSNKQIGGTLPSIAKVLIAGKYSTSATAPTVFAPAMSGDFTVFATANDATGSTLSAMSNVEGTADAGLALDAANAATDAANNAYDEAQNATQAASDALAAVTALSAQVGALIATVKSLAAVVAKIKAKVKA